MVVTVLDNALWARQHYEAVEEAELMALLHTSEGLNFSKTSWTLLLKTHGRPGSPAWLILVAKEQKSKYLAFPASVLDGALGGKLENAMGLANQRHLPQLSSCSPQHWSIFTTIEHLLILWSSFNVNSGKIRKVCICYKFHPLSQQHGGTVCNRLSWGLGRNISLWWQRKLLNPAVWMYLKKVQTKVSVLGLTFHSCLFLGASKSFCK